MDVGCVGVGGCEIWGMWVWGLWMGGGGWGWVSGHGGAHLALGCWGLDSDSYACIANSLP